MSEMRAVIAHNVTAMRAEPDGRCEQVSQAIFGETVQVLQEQDRWAEIETPDGYRGWALRQHLQMLHGRQAYPKPARAAEALPLFMPVVRQPNDRSERILLLTIGSAIEIAEADDTDLPTRSHILVRLPRGDVGYVRTVQIRAHSVVAPKASGRYPVKTAMKFIGVPYLWGGRTPFGIDCSGFTQRVYGLCGHTIPRDAYLQARWKGFAPVLREQLQAGDLIFFAGDQDPRGRGITHVGMALGDGRFIHAAGDTGVAVLPLNTPPYDRQFHSAGRLRPSP